MLNGEGNEGGNKISKSNYPKKVTNLHVQHTFLYIYLRLFCTTVACVPVRFHFFTAAYFHLAGRSLLAAMISHFLTTAMKFHVFLLTKFVSFVFNICL